MRRLFFVLQSCFFLLPGLWLLSTAARGAQALRRKSFLYHYKFCTFICKRNI
jgi:hypothetical protein